jgi:transposase-like protein
VRRPRRNHSAKFKFAIAALKGDKTVVELSEQFDVDANQITEWKIQLLKQAEHVLTKAELKAAESGHATCESIATSIPRSSSQRRLGRSTEIPAEWLFAPRGQRQI